MTAKLAETQLWQQNMASLIRSGLFSKAITGEMNGLYTVVGVYSDETHSAPVAKYSDLATCDRRRQPRQQPCQGSTLRSSRTDPDFAADSSRILHGLRPDKAGRPFSLLGSSCHGSHETDLGRIQADPDRGWRSLACAAPVRRVASRCPPTARHDARHRPRLSRSYSERELTAHRVPRRRPCSPSARSGERAALARGYLRFHVDRPVIVDVAVPVASVPFWIADQGFQTTGPAFSRTPTLPGSSIASVSRRERRPGRQRSRPHAARALRRFRQAERQRQAGDLAHPIVTLDARSAASWKLAVAAPGRQRRPRLRTSHSSRFPPIWRARSCSSPPTATGIRRSWPRAASGRRTSVAHEQPSQVAIAFGTDPATRARLDLDDRRRTSTSTCHSRLPDCRSSAQDATGDQWRMPEPRSNRVAASRRLIEVPNLLNDPVIRRHRVAVDRLEPDTVYRYSLGDGTLRRLGTVANRQDRHPTRSAGARFLYLGDAQTGLEGWGRLLDAAHRRHPDDRFHPARRRPRRPRQRADQLGPFLPPRRRRLRSRAPDALRGQPRVPRRRAPPLSRVLRAAPQRPERNRPRPGLPLRVRRRLLRRARQHARRLRPAAAKRQADWLDATLRTHPGFLEIRDASSPDLPVPSLARHASPARATGCRSSTSITSISSCRATITPTSGRTPCAAIAALARPAERHDLPDGRLRRQVRRPGRPRLRRSGAHRRLDLSDHRDRPVARTA